jgi:hypothetical protein
MGWISAGTLISAGLAATASAALLLAAWMAMRLRYYRRVRSEAAPNGQAAFPPSTYDFMSLLSEDDFDFLASLPGYRPEIGKKLRFHHERILRLYLCELAQEFHSVHAEAREILATAGEEHAPAVGLLMRQQLVFWQSMARIELSFAIPGLSAARWDKARASALAGIVEAIAAMRAAVEPGAAQQTAEAL